MLWLLLLYLAIPVLPNALPVLQAHVLLLPAHPPGAQLRGITASEGSGNSPFDAAADLLRNFQPPSGPSKYDPVYCLLKEALLLEVRAWGVARWQGNNQHELPQVAACSPGRTALRLAACCLPPPGYLHPPGS